MPAAAIVAGEASGDASGAALARELRRLCPDIALWGAGGPKMRDAGVELLADFSRAGAIGIVQSLKQVPSLLGEFKKLKRVMLERRPDVFIPIDFGAFNVRLGWFAREHGIPTVYYFPPGSWRRRPRDQSNLLRAADRFIAPFPWSAALLSESGADAVFSGHPMLDRVAPTMSRQEFLEGLRLPTDTRVIGLLPGSRSHEIRSLLPVLLDASKWVSDRVPSVRGCVIAASSDRALGEIRHIMLRSVAGGTKVADGRGCECTSAEDDLPVQYRAVLDAAYDVMAHSDVLLTCSGTATLEAMILGTPMIIAYRGSRMMKIEYMLRKGILEEFIGMPNIIAGREICPELLGDEASPEAIANLAVEFLERPEKMEEMRRELRSAKAALGEPGGTARAAKLVLQTAGLPSTE